MEYTGAMKRTLQIAFLLSLCFALPAESADLTNAENDFISAYAQKGFSENAYRKLAELDAERAAVLKTQAESVDRFFAEVLKTEKQLVPKQCNYLVIYGYAGSSAADLKKGCDNLRLAVLANMDRPTMKVFLTGSESNIAAFREALKKTSMPKDRIFDIPCINNREAATKTIPIITADFNGSAYDRENLLYRRIMLLTNASNARTGFAAFVSALGANASHMIFDDFSSLDITRKQLDKPSGAERSAAFSELKKE